jgi:hypothetical protein
MALDKSSLQSDLRAALKAASNAANEDPVPSSDEILDLISRKLATAIDAYVRSAEVQGVQVTVRDVTTDVTVTPTVTSEGNFEGSGVQSGTETAAQSNTVNLT